MTKRIFKSTMLVVVIVVLLCGIFILGVIYDYYSKKLQSELYNEAIYVSRGVELGGLEYLAKMDSAQTRITWVAADGTVLYDNRADASGMDNHAGRQEIQEALHSSAGDSVRFSNTLSERTVYRAVRLADGSVLRVAGTQNSVAVLVLGMLWPITVVLVLAIILSAVLTYRLTRQIIAPLEGIDLDCPEEAEVYDEMTPFIQKIILQNREIHEAMARLREKQNEFNIITENMQEGFIVIDKNATVLSHNSSAVRLFGVSCKVENRSVLILNRTKEFRQAVDMALDGRHNERILPTGTRFYNIYMNPVFDGKQVMGAIIIVTDVTEREERENLRREFSANVSHELKTPLTSISGIAEIIKSGIVDEKDIPGFAGKIYDEAKRLIALVGDIIRVSQLDEAAPDVSHDSVDLYETAKRVAEHMKTAADKRGIEIQVTGETVRVMGNPTILEEMIYNLCDNAVKYNRDNGKVVIEVCKPEESGGRITVSDTGIGIAKDEQERVFERFYRVDKSHSREIGGTGLGLSIVKHGARLHNAVIEMESEPSRGTRISVIF